MRTPRAADPRAGRQHGFSESHCDAIAPAQLSLTRGGTHESLLQNNYSVTGISAAAMAFRGKKTRPRRYGKTHPL